MLKIILYDGEYEIDGEWLSQHSKMVQRMFSTSMMKSPEFIHLEGISVNTFTLIHSTLNGNIDWLVSNKLCDDELDDIFYAHYTVFDYLDVTIRMCLTFSERRDIYGAIDNTIMAKNNILRATLFQQVLCDHFSGIVSPAEYVRTTGYIPWYENDIKYNALDSRGTFISEELSLEELRVRNKHKLTQYRELLTKLKQSRTLLVPLRLAIAEKCGPSSSHRYLLTDEEKKVFISRLRIFSGAWADTIIPDEENTWPKGLLLIDGGYKDALSNRDLGKLRGIDRLEFIIYGPDKDERHRRFVEAFRYLTRGPSKVYVILDDMSLTIIRPFCQRTITLTYTTCKNIGTMGVDYYDGENVSYSEEFDLGYREGYYARYLLSSYDLTEIYLELSNYGYCLPKKSRLMISRKIFSDGHCLCDDHCLLSNDLYGIQRKDRFFEDIVVKKLAKRDDVKNYINNWIIINDDINDEYVISLLRKIYCENGQEFVTSNLDEIINRIK